MDIPTIIKNFVERAQKNRLEIYNEISLQLELAIFLREILGDGFKVQLERNISFLGLKGDFVKKEIDIIIFKDGHELNDSIAIELKAVINQAHARPITVFNWITDLKFLEQLKSAGIGRCYSLFVTDHNALLTTPGGPEPKSRLLPDFRVREMYGTYSTHATLNKKNKYICLNSKYKFNWNKFVENQQYFILEIV